MTDLLALDRQVCFAVVAASRSVVNLYKPILETLGLTHPQYLVMLALWERSPLRVKDLGERLLLDPATLSPLLKRLEREGRIIRSRDSADERALAIGLTPEGWALRVEAEQVPAQVVERLGLSIGELEAIQKAATTLLHACRVANAGSDDLSGPADNGDLQHQ
jgi:DNA-binding MarR family transcriptional regulator